MTARRRTLLVALAALLGPLGLAAAPPAVAQQHAPAASAGPASEAGVTRSAALTAERARVRADLDRVNAEVDGLKRGARGIRDDYRLRARLADAEALARRLTEIDAQLGGGAAGGGAQPARPSALGSEPSLAPSDGPAEMDAKADILADQARRLGTEALTLQQRAQQLRARHDLRRRIGQMERDPFTPLEGSKRRIVAGAAGNPRASENAGAGAKDQAPAAPAVSTPAPPSSGFTGGPNDSTGTTVTGGGPTNTVPGTQNATGSRAGVAPLLPPSPMGASAGPEGGALSVQLRDLLDASTLGELRRLEASGAPAAGVEALERAAAALRARAERLQSQSQALRARARAPR